MIKTKEVQKFLDSVPGLLSANALAETLKIRRQALTHYIRQDMPHVRFKKKGNVMRLFVLDDVLAWGKARPTPQRGSPFQWAHKDAGSKRKKRVRSRE